ncbi:hypothetical protein [Rubinisphaera italica]|uniref:Uncharacterized protein n=1 Tax=Rubinisphaera italica TaxID=2527969 RepID=A0A5C5XML9_9PLAN|nr:hypothetical protein [Rubinisphaera italica]TWT64407.1 hypothetical protein Pan54_51690 [Rubinisphaera italica]
MSKLYDAVHGVLAKGPRTTEQIVAECRRPGLPFRPETIELFLELSKEIEQRDGNWQLPGQHRADAISEAIDKAFADGKTYVPIDQIGKHLDEDQAVTDDDIGEVCEERGKYQIKGKFIVRRTN